MKKTFQAGIKVVSAIFYEVPANLAMANKLDCNLKHTSLRTSFKHPSCDQDVVVYSDPPHMLKLIRNALGENLFFVTAVNERIEWKYFVKLHELQQSETLANKLREEHIAFKKQKMKVRLATHLFTECIATALEFCANVFQIEDFKGTRPTIKFIKLMNNLFDVLDSRSSLQFNYKKPLWRTNFDNVSISLDNVDTYIAGLKTHVSGSLQLDTNRHTGFLGLNVCIASTKLLYNSFIVDNVSLKFLPLYKICQDNL